MGYADVSDSGAVLEAIGEFDRIGRQAFLEKYGFKGSRAYFVRHGRGRYDSKPILAAAHGYQFGKPLLHTEFSGGEHATVRKLRELGFEVEAAAGDGALTRFDVESTLARYDEIGREAFLREYGGRGAAKFLIAHEGREYDAKAVLVVALRRHPEHEDLEASDVASTRQGVAVPLERLGYTIVEREAVGDRRIAGLIERVLELQLSYNPSPTDPTMQERRRMLEELDQALVDACGPTFGWPGAGTWTLSGDVSLGAGNLPRCAWARLMDKGQSPSAQSGWYVVLLFAEDGSSCVVSLNQGTTSVTGPGANQRIREKAVAALEFLDGSSDGAAGRVWGDRGGVPSERFVGEPELGDGGLARQYSKGHVDGVVYRPGAVPDDGVIVQHVETLLLMLGKIYDRGEDPPAGVDATHVLIRVSAGQAAGRDTVAEHRAVADAKGEVVWAKFGKPLSDQRVRDLTEQIESGVETRAYLMTGAPQTLVRAEIKAVRQGTSSVDGGLIPSYYRDSLTGDETCFVLGRIETEDLFPRIDELIYMSSDSAKPWVEILGSITNVFFVKERNVAPVQDPRAATHQPSDRVRSVAEKVNMSVEEVQRLVDSVNGKKRQMIFAGPPGTGKTFVAQEIAGLLVDDPSCINLVQFHPSYGYEDFIEGLRPLPSKGGGFEFKRVPGVVVDLAEKIEFDGRTRVLIVDEINRANIPKVFGELMYLLEYRDKSMRLMLDDRDFVLPSNLIIIGTMNTADRSIRTLDVAMRRRFRFHELPPRPDVIERQYRKPGWTNELGAELWLGLDRLNARLKVDVDRHHQIGHSYLMYKTMTSDVLKDVWSQEIFPLIEDYFFDRPDLAEAYKLEEFWPGG